MGQIVAVLFELFPDPVLLDRLALEFDIEGTVRVRGEFEQIKFLADMFNGIGKIKSVEERDPVITGLRMLLSGFSACSLSGGSGT